MPANRKTVKCRGCEADIFFGITPADNAIPLDVKETRVAVLDSDGKHVSFVNGHVPHHITCPNAADFRKRSSKGV